MIFFSSYNCYCKWIPPFATVWMLTLTLYEILSVTGEVTAKRNAANKYLVIFVSFWSVWKYMYSVLEREIAVCIGANRLTERNRQKICNLNWGQFNALFVVSSSRTTTSRSTHFTLTIIHGAHMTERTLTHRLMPCSTTTTYYYTTTTTPHTLSQSAIYTHTHILP